MECVRCKEMHYYFYFPRGILATDTFLKFRSLISCLYTSFGAGERVYQPSNNSEHLFFLHFPQLATASWFINPWIASGSPFAVFN